MHLAAPALKRQRHEIVFASAIIAGLVAILVALPRHYRLLPEGSEVAIGASFIAFLWSRYARVAVAFFAAVIASVEIVILWQLLYEMAIRPSDLNGLLLMWTTVDLWLANVVLFTLVYWQLDRGGPSGRAGAWNGRVDFHFPRGDAADGVPADWQPSFTDYLYLAFTTSTAFSPSEIYPLTDRAKILHILQSLVSLLIVVALASRAIDVLGQGK